MEKISSLEDHVGYWLRFVSNHVHTAFSAKLSDSGVTVAEWVILRHLFEEDGMPQANLVKITGLTKGAISKLIDRLDNKKLIVQTISDDDSRAHFIQISKGGLRLVPKISRLADENDREFFKCLNQRELTLLIDLMRRVVHQNSLQQRPLN